MIKWKLSGLFLCVAISAMVLNGCVIANSNKSFTGTRVSNETLKRVEIGKTTRQWLVGVLGEPTSTTESPEGAEILKYDCVIDSKSTVHVSLIFSLINATETKKTSQAHYFEVKDGIVQAHWEDSARSEKASHIH